MDDSEKLVAAQLATAVIAKREKASTPREAVEVYLRICGHLGNIGSIEAEMNKKANRILKPKFK